MGGTTFYLSGKTEGEVQRKISKRLVEAKNYGMYEDRRSDIIYRPTEKKFIAVLRVHT